MRDDFSMRRNPNDGVGVARDGQQPAETLDGDAISGAAVRRRPNQYRSLRICGFGVEWERIEVGGIAAEEWRDAAEFIDGDEARILTPFFVASAYPALQVFDFVAVEIAANVHAALRGRCYRSGRHSESEQPCKDSTGEAR